jgi:Tol biopolymer transport system component
MGDAVRKLFAGIERGRVIGCCALLLGLTQPLLAQVPDKSWDVTKPRGAPARIDFNTSEGTWMSTDITADGQWIVFNLLSHVYRVRATGGDAECLTQNSGIAVNFHPRISPDGKTIAFISDRNGQSNIWLMDLDGGHPRPVTSDTNVRYMEPTWSPDGRFLVARKIDAVKLLDVSIVMVHRDGGQGTTLVKVENNMFPGGPKFSADGRYVYYEVLAGPVNGTYNDTDTLQGDAQVRRLDLTTGRIDPITAGHVSQQDQGSSGGAYAVEPSPDGRFLAFARRMPDGLLSYKGKLFGPRTALWVRDLESGSERLVMDPVEYDFAEGLAPIDQTLPGYRWTADGRAIVISQGGKIRRLDLASAQVSTIAFNARVQRNTSERVKPSVRLSDGPFETKFARWHTVSPDGRTLAFQAVGRIWLMDLPSGTPRRLTPESSQPYEYYPAWSPDGRSIAFVTWDEKESGQLWVAGINGGSSKPIARQPAEYLAPAWAPDGQSLIAARGAGATARGQGLTRNQYWELVNVSLAGGEARPVARVTGLIPQVSFANGRLFYYEPASDGLTLISVTLDGLDRREHLKATHAGEIAVSPDAKWLAFTLGANAFIAPMSATGYAGALPVIGKSGGALPVTQLSTLGGLFPRWRNARTLTFGNGNQFVSYDVASKRTDATTIKLSVPRDLPRGSIALTNARILTMENRQVIAKGTIVVRAGRIVCVGDCNTAGVDHTVDVAGRTVMPGMIDMHAHHHREYVAIQPPHDFETAIYLAYGVTTTFDPTTSSFGVFPTAELIEAGGMIGPRVFTTAEFMIPRETAWTNENNSAAAMFDDAKRRVQWGAMGLKDYMQGTRNQRQWVVEAGRQLGVMVTAEGSLDIDHKISLALDGHTGFEHSTAHAPLYSDFTTLLGRLGSAYSATPLAGGPGAWSEQFFWQQSDVWKDAKQQRWMPWRQLIPHTRRRMLRPPTDYSIPLLAQAAADIVAAGGIAPIGSHGQQHGIGSHWDTWIYAEAMGPMGALEAATLHGAKFLGMERDLGSIAVGKLGDIVVLDADPLENIRNSASIRYVLKAGVLYDADSLDELWPRQRPFGDYYWHVPDMYRSDVRPIDYHDHSQPPTQP